MEYPRIKFTIQYLTPIDTEYDILGRVTKQTDPIGGTTLYEYSSVGLLLSLTDAEGNRTEFTYDLAGRMLTMKDPLGDVSTYEYDKLGRRVSQTGPLGNVTRTFYDFKGRTTKTIDALGLGRAMEYDPNGNMVKATEPGRVTRPLIPPPLHPLPPGEGRTWTHGLSGVGLMQGVMPSTT